MTHDGMDGMVECLAGSFCPVGAAVPLPCPSNSNSGDGASTCVCRGGYAASGTGASLVCTACTPGTYSAGNGTACVACPAASNSTAAATTCLCISGYQAVPGSASCTGMLPPRTWAPMDIVRVRLTIRRRAGRVCAGDVQPRWRQLPWYGGEGLRSVGPLIDMPVCAVCPAGSYCLAGVATPTVCPDNSDSAAGAPNCTCLAGYSSNTGFATTLACSGA
jgi:hypothetical protein